LLNKGVCTDCHCIRGEEELQIPDKYREDGIERWYCWTPRLPEKGIPHNSHLYIVGLKSNIPNYCPYHLEHTICNEQPS